MKYSSFCLELKWYCWRLYFKKLAKLEVMALKVVGVELVSDTLRRAEG
jgi:hypothetical protein